MELKRDSWNVKDINEFKHYEKSLQGTEKSCVFEKTITKTNLECLGIKASQTKQIVKEIKQGDFYDFLDIMLNQAKIETLFESYVCAHLICQIKDFDVFKNYLDKFVSMVDNWASADTLKFKKYDKVKLCNLSKEYLESNNPFIRRVGVNIWLDLIKKQECLSKAFNLIDTLKNEENYYVNMSAAWLLSYCMVYNRNETIKYFKHSQTSKFIINKAISKCRDSFRVSKEDKNILLSFRL